MCSYHVDQLCNGEAKLDDDHVADVLRRTRPLSVASKQAPEELVLHVDTSPVFRQHWQRDTGREEEEEEGELLILFIFLD